MDQELAKIYTEEDIKIYSEDEVDKERQAMLDERMSTEEKLVLRRNQFAEALKNGLGEDMKLVLEGKRQTKVPFWTRTKFKIKCFFMRLFQII